MKKQKEYKIMPAGNKIMPLYKTGVAGLDELLRGGLVLPSSNNGLIVLIKGRPGAGKTTLALQIAGGSCKWNNSQCKEIEVYSYEQDPQDIKALCDRLGVTARISPEGVNNGEPYVSINANAGIRTTPESPIDIRMTIRAWAYGLAAQLNSLQDRKRRLVVVDGLNMLSAEERQEFVIEDLISSMRKNTQVGIIVFEAAGSEVGGIASQVDMIIELRGQEIEEPVKYFLNHLSIVKSRFQRSVLGWHQYKIRERRKGDAEHKKQGNTGITIFPSLHYRTHRDNLLEDRLKESKLPLSCIVLKPEEKRKTIADEKSILGRLIGPGNLKQGSCTVVLGPRRTWKTQLTMDFLRAGSCAREPGLLLSLLDNEGTIVGQRSCLCEAYCIGNDPNCSNNESCYKQVYLFHFRPGCIAPNEFFYYLDRRLNEKAKEQKKPIGRLAFWDLTQLESRFPLLAGDHMFLAGLMDYLKNSEYDEEISKKFKRKKRNITSVFMGAAKKKLAQAASAMADNVIFCWEDNYMNEGQGIALYVDRIEGQPGGKKLAFLNVSDVSKTKTAHKIEEILIENCDEEKLPYAESMIEEIRGIEGLPARKRSEPICVRQTDENTARPIEKEMQ